MLRSDYVSALRAELAYAQTLPDPVVRESRVRDVQAELDRFEPRPAVATAKAAGRRPETATKEE